MEPNKIFHSRTGVAYLSELIDSDSVYHHLTRVQVYAASDDEDGCRTSDAFAITEKQGKLTLQSVSDDQLHRANQLRIKGLNVVLDFVEDSCGEHIRLHIIQRKGQTILELDKTPHDIHLSDCDRKMQEAGKAADDDDDDEPCDVCNGSGEAYLTEGLHGACMACNADNIANVPMYEF